MERSREEMLRASAIDFRARRDAAEQRMQATDLPIDHSAWSMWAYVTQRIEALLTVDWRERTWVGPACVVCGTRESRDGDWYRVCLECRWEEL